MTDAPTDDLDFWKALHEILSAAERSLPWGDDPRKVSWDHPDEVWKNEAELANYELELKSQVHELVAYFCENRAWPKKVQVRRALPAIAPSRMGEGFFSSSCRAVDASRRRCISEA